MFPFSIKGQEKGYLGGRILHKEKEESFFILFYLNAFKKYGHFQILWFILKEGGIFEKENIFVLKLYYRRFVL